MYILIFILLYVRTTFYLKHDIYATNQTPSNSQALAPCSWHLKGFSIQIYK